MLFPSQLLWGTFRQWLLEKTNEKRSRGETGRQWKIDKTKVKEIFHHVLGPSVVLSWSLDLWFSQQQNVHAHYHVVQLVTDCPGRGRSFMSAQLGGSRRLGSFGNGLWCLCTLSSVSCHKRKWVKLLTALPLQDPDLLSLTQVAESVSHWSLTPTASGGTADAHAGNLECTGSTLQYGWVEAPSFWIKELSWVQKGGSVDNSGKAAMCKKGSDHLGFRCGW